MFDFMLRLIPAALLIATVVVQTGVGHRSEAVASDLADMDNEVDIKEHGSLEDFEMRDEEIEALKMELEKEQSHRVDLELRLLNAEGSAQQRADGLDKEAKLASIEAHGRVAGEPDQAATLCAAGEEPVATCCTRNCLGSALGSTACKEQCVQKVTEMRGVKLNVPAVNEEIQQLNARGLDEEMVQRAKNAATQCKDEVKEKKDGCCWRAEEGCPPGMPQCVKKCLKFIEEMLASQALSEDTTVPDTQLYEACLADDLLTDAEGYLLSKRPTLKGNTADKGKTLAGRDECCYTNVCDPPPSCTGNCAAGVTACKHDCIDEVRKNCNGDGGECH